MKNFFYKAFIAPFTSSQRAIVYLSALIGQFGFYGLMVYLAFDLTSTELKTVFSFFAAKFIISNLILLPLLFMFLRRYYNRITLSIFSYIQCASFLVLLFFADSLMNEPNMTNAFIIGLIISFISEPFWAAYHTMMLKVTSDDNRGHEVSMAELGMRIGVTLGSFAAGFMLTFMPGKLFLLFSAFCMISPTIFMAGLALSFDKPKVQNLDLFKPYRRLFDDHQLTISTILQGVLNSLTSFYVPIWLKIIGFSALVTGSVMSAQVFVRLLAGPITGHLYEKGKGREISIGGFIYTLAWLPWLIVQNTAMFLISAMMWAIYGHMVNVGLDSRWYAHKTLSGMASREICLGLGRLICCLTILPLLSISALYFFIGSALAGIVFILHAKGFDRESH